MKVFHRVCVKRSSLYLYLSLPLDLSNFLYRPFSTDLSLPTFLYRPFSTDLSLPLDLSVSLSLPLLSAFSPSLSVCLFFLSFHVVSPFPVLLICLSSFLSICLPSFSIRLPSPAFLPFFSFSFVSALSLPGKSRIFFWHPLLCAHFLTAIPLICATMFEWNHRRIFRKPHTTTGGMAQCCAAT
jgi:hypothetical protein